jgi:hypothetical protein
MSNTHCFAMMKRMMSSMINREIKIGVIYQHYKGNFYEVIAIARDSENPESRRVIYKALYDTPKFGRNSVWDRSYEMFAEEVIINGIKQDRFKEIISKKA